MPWVPDRSEEVRNPDAPTVHGRPDFAEPGWGDTFAKRHPPYVFAIRKNAGLIHKIERVRLQWWQIHYDKLVRANRPNQLAETVCGMSFSLRASRARTCVVPRMDAFLCGRCHGEFATFGKRGLGRSVKRAEAHVKLGCVVNGYGGRTP